MAKYVKLTVNYDVPGSSVPNNVFFFDNATEDADTLVFDAVEEWLTTEWGAEWSELAASAAGIASFVVSEVDLLGIILGTIGTGVTGIVGLDGSAPNAAGVAASLFANTDRPKSRGRKFIPGIPENATDGGLFVAATLGDLAVLLVKYFTAFEATNGVELVPGVISTVTNTFLEFNGTGGFDDIPDYQIRRRPDRGS